MIKSLNTPAGQLVSGALLAIAATAAYLVGGQGTGEALIVGAPVFGVMLLLTLSVLCAAFALVWLATVVVLSRRA